MGDRSLFLSLGFPGCFMPRKENGKTGVSSARAKVFAGKTSTKILASKGFSRVVLPARVSSRSKNGSRGVRLGVQNGRDLRGVPCVLVTDLKIKNMRTRVLAELLTASSAFAEAADMPKRKSELWEIKVAHDKAESGHSGVYKIYRSS